MAVNSTIEWTDTTWNPVTGCTKVSAGCDNCYAEAIANRFVGTKAFPNGFDLTLKPERISQPLRWRKARMIFVNSMSDLFHKDIPRSFVDSVFDTMESADWHIYQILTKRSSIMRDYLSSRYADCACPPHIWLGVSIEDERARVRLKHLQDAPASIRFLSIEPLLGPVQDIDLTGIHWVIVGGESGVGARPTQPDWVRGIRDACLSAKVPFFFKQWGGARPKSNGRMIDGREWNEYPRNQRNHIDERHFGKEHL